MTTAYNFPVIRWPVALVAGSLTIRFKETGGAGVSLQAMAANTYIIDGDTGATPYFDLIDEIEDAAQAAMTAIHGAGTVTIALNSSGFMTLIRVGGGDIDIQPTAIDALTTFDLGRLGLSTVASTVITTTLTTASFQVEGAWYPGIDPERDSGDQDRTLWRENQSLSGRVSRVKHTDKVWFDRFLRFDFIPSARVFQARLDVTAYATVAGLAALDPNAAFVNVREYLLDGTTPQPGVVYVYDTSDPLTAVHSGPYQVITEDVWNMDTGGITDESLVQSMSSEHYRIKIHLRREAV